MSEHNLARTDLRGNLPSHKPEKGFVARAGLLKLLVFFFALTFAYGLSMALVQEFLLPHIAEHMRGIVALVGSSLGAGLTIGVYALLVRRLEQRPLVEMSRERLPQLAGGIALALVLFSAIYVIYFALGTAHWKGFGGTGYVLSFAGLAVISGFCEEAIFRGGAYRIIEEMFGSATALIFSGALFGLLHLGNPNATVLAGVAIAVEAGILLGAAYAATRSLWLPIGIHIGWNFAEGGIFGASVSGMPAGRGIFNIPLTGPDWLTGGGFGPEASVVTLAICTAAGIYLVWRTIKNGHWCRARFRMMLD